MDILKKYRIPLFILFGVVLFTLLRLPSLYEPHWYGDEGVYASVAREMSYGEVLYEDIWDNKPSMIYWIYMLAGRSTTLFWVRMFSLLAGLITVIGIYKISRKLFNPSIAIVAFFVSILLLATPQFEGNIANGENFFLPFVVWGYYLTLIGNKNRFWFFLAGVLFAFAVLIKVIALVSLGAMGMYLIVTKTKLISKKPQVRDSMKLLPLSLGFLVILAAYAIRQFMAGTLGSTLDSTLLEMFKYVGDESSDFLGLVFIELSMKMKLLLFIGLNAVLLINYYAKRFSHRTYFIVLIFIFEYFGTITSSRHYIHYLLQMIPGFALAAALLVHILKQQSNLISRLNYFLIFMVIIYFSLITFSQGRGMTTNYAAWHYQDRGTYFKLFMYYKTFFDYKITHSISKLDYDYFYNQEESKMDQIGLVLQEQFPDISRSSIYLYTDRSWSYPYLGIRVPTTFCVSYHRYIREGGDATLMSDLYEFKPELMVVEKSIPTFDPFDEMLDQEYMHVYEDDLYLYYLRY